MGEYGIKDGNIILDLWLLYYHEIRCSNGHEVTPSFEMNFPE